MLSNQSLKKENYNERKVVKESLKCTTWHKKEKDIFKINKYHFTPVELKYGYRTGKNIAKGAKWILIDVDEPDDNVEEKLIEYKLYYIKAPSGSATDKINYKWHYFVKTKRLSSDAAIARAQINDFYTVLGLINIDPTSIDPVRYFAPCGCAEVLGSDAWDKRIKWCNKRTKIVKGNLWVPNEDINPIYTTRGTAAYISELETVGAPAFDSEGDYKVEVIKHNPLTNTFKLNPKNKIYTQDGWTTLEEIASKMKEGEVVSNYFGCPVHNMDHEEPTTIGYGFAKRDKHITWFNCGGNSCKDKKYYIANKKNKR